MYSTLVQNIRKKSSFELYNNNNNIIVVCAFVSPIASLSYTSNQLQCFNVPLYS